MMPFGEIFPNHPEYLLAIVDIIMQPLKVGKPILSEHLTISFNTPSSRWMINVEANLSYCQRYESKVYEWQFQQEDAQCTKRYKKVKNSPCSQPYRLDD